MSPSEKLQKAEDLITDAMNDVTLHENNVALHFYTNYAGAIRAVSAMIRDTQEAGQ